MRFPRVIFWEAIQNLPLVAGFVTAFQFWRQDNWPAAIICIAAGSILGSVLIRITESRIVQGFSEPMRVTLANIAMFAVLMLVAIAYLSAIWSNWKLDLLVGGLAGTVLGIGQDLAARESIGVGHCAALACSGPLILISMRTLIFALPVLASILIITGAITLVISLTDYGDDRSIIP